ncbi:MAG: filamentous hemagglutinin N-terminal domain-containing protein [Thermoguttaceae bacterium]|jgi:filamentous hemagglutinin family protein|nr:filamentous hemagglutinin N-terminal domain-containing protein [Thermoguttaceae bacterium]
MRFSLSHPTMRHLAAMLILLQTVAAPAPLLANPTGGEVVAGSAAIASHGSTLDVTTHTDRAVINWQGFSIGAGETANFIQPGADSAVLNRVTTPDNPSAIYGQLNSNGNVFLVNPSGILIGPTGMINVNGFTASVFDISNHEFMSGGPLTFRGDSTASVVNQGAIYTGASGVALLGHQVINSGLVSSDGGAITLATGGSITLADGSRYIQADLKTLASGISETASLIKNSGVIRVTGALKTGGQVYLVNPAGNILHDGTIKADRLAEAGRSGGSVKLEAAQGETRVEGSIDVSGDTGGRVEVLGQKVELAGAAIDAGGAHGGGVILAGGDFQGGNPDVLNAQRTTVDARSVLKADATAQGDGGRIILWADGSLEFHGSITARGGEFGGDGGFAEVSGLGSLTFHGLADLGATAGAGGQLLLDPTDVIIDAGSALLISAMLNTGTSVTVYTAAGGTDPGNITLTSGAVISWNTSSRLALLARQDIWLHGQITATADGSVILVAGWDGSPFAAASGTYGGGDGSVWADTFTGQPVLVTSDSGDVRVYTHTLHVLGGYGANPAVIGSRNGATAVEALGHVLLHGGGSYAQLGYHGSGTAGGPISVNAGGAVCLVAEEEGVTAQIGHGGAGAAIDVDAPIAVTAGSVVYLLAAGEDATAQIGHGGAGSRSSGATLAGDITVQSGPDFFQDEQGWAEFTHLHGVGLEAPGLDATAQIGHGGYGFAGGASGDVEVTTEGTVGLYNSMSSDSWWGASGTAQIGHGGCSAEGVLVGNISVACGEDFGIHYDRDDGSVGYVHYNGLRLSAGGGGIGVGGGTAQIGHGGRDFSGHSQGNIEVASDGTIALQASGYSEDLAGSTAQIGHGGYAAEGSTEGTIGVECGENLVFEDELNNFWVYSSALQMASDGSRATTQIGHGGYSFRGLPNSGTGVFSGAVVVEAVGAVNLEARIWTEGELFGTTAQIGHGGYDAQGSAQGEVRVDSGSGYSTYWLEEFPGIDLLSEGSRTTAQIGHGGYAFSGNAQGTVTVLTEGGAWLNARRNELPISPEGQEATAQIGHGGCGAQGAMSGTVSLITGAGTWCSLYLDAYGDQTTAQIGHGGRGAEGDMFDDVLVETAGSLRMDTSGKWYWQDDQHYYDPLAGTAQIGHGGFGARGSANGSVSVLCGVDDDGRAFHAFAHGINGTVQIGHGGRQFTGTDLLGNVSVTCEQGSVYLSGSDSTGYWVAGSSDEKNWYYDPNAGSAQIGHGGYAAELQGSAEGGVTVICGSNNYDSSLSVSASGLQAVAQIGHGGRDFRGGMTGAVSIDAAGYVDVWGRNAEEYLPDPDNPDEYIWLDHPADSTAQIGHGGFGARGLASGLITVTSGASDWGTGVELGSSGAESTAQIGHGGRGFAGEMCGAVQVTTEGAVNVTARAGYDDTAGSFTFGNTAQIGHGGYGAQGPATGSVTLTGGARSNGQGLHLAGIGDRNTAHIGHGGYGYNGRAAGDVLVQSDGSVSVYCWAPSHQDPYDELLQYYDTAGGTAQIGHGGRAAQGGAAGDITITSGVDDWSFGLYVCASDGQVELHDATVHVGHGGRGWTGAASGDIAVATAGDARLWSGNTNNDAQIGHGGRNSGGAGDALSGAIEIIAGVGLHANATAASNAWIAHGGPGSANPVTGGDILLAYDQIDPIVYGGGNFVLGATAYIGAPVGQAPAGLVQIVGTQREGNSIHNGAAIGGVAFNNALPRPSLSGNQWNWAPRTGSWAHEQWGYSLVALGPYSAPFTFFFWHDTQESGPVFDLTWASVLEGASAYDRFIRPQDQWRTLSYLLGGPRRGRGIGYGSKPQSDDGENLVEVSSFDLFGPGSE